MSRGKKSDPRLPHVFFRKALTGDDETERSEVLSDPARGFIKKLKSERRRDLNRAKRGLGRGGSEDFKMGWSRIGLFTSTKTKGKEIYIH